MDNFYSNIRRDFINLDKRVPRNKPYYCNIGVIINEEYAKILLKIFKEYLLSKNTSLKFHGSTDDFRLAVGCNYINTWLFDSHVHHTATFYINRSLGDINAYLDFGIVNGPMNRCYYYSMEELLNLMKADNECFTDE